MVGHSCVLSWWEAVKEERAPVEWNYYREKVTQGLQSAHMVIAPTQAMLAALEKHYGPLIHKDVIANGCQIEEFALNFSLSQACTKEESQRFVFTAGRVWDEAKNIAALEAVAPSLICPVYIAGEKREPRKHCRDVKFRISSQEEEGLVQFLGRLSKQEMQEWYARAAIYALPAKYEPFGLSVLEAALSGCALILGDIPSLRENWDETAVFVQPNDWEGLRHAINDLSENPHRCDHLARQSRSHALAFTSQRMAESYLSAYQSIIYDE
jgi:glycosyltransferase involved in cell wall biosynthesis